MLLLLLILLLLVLLLYIYIYICVDNVICVYMFPHTCIRYVNVCKCAHEGRKDKTRREDLRDSLLEQQRTILAQHMPAGACSNGSLSCPD